MMQGRGSGAARFGVIATVAACLVALAAGCGPRGGADDSRAPLALPITIVANPGPFGTIAEAATAEARVDWWDGEPRDDDACTESFAASELREQLAASLKVAPEQIRLAIPADAPDSGTVIVVGTRRSIPSFGGIDLPELPQSPGASGFRIRREERDGRTVVTVAGASRIGALYGAYALLERAGLRFYGLGETGTVRSALPSLPSRLDVSESPGYDVRGFWAWEPRGNRDFFLWMARNRMNLWTVEEPDHPFLAKLGIRLIAGGHQVQLTTLDPATYFRAHPEWYGLLNGRRDPNIGTDTGTNFCTSNPAATAMLAHNLVGELSEGEWRHADVLAFWMLDNSPWCSCEPCARMGGPTDRLFEVLRVVSDSVKAARSDGRLARSVEVTTLAFLETVPPPARPVAANLFDGRFAVTFFPIDRCYVHSLEDPACADINASYVPEYQAWSAPSGHYRGPMEIGEYYNIGEVKSLPVVLTGVIRHDVPWYFRNGARRFHTMHAPTRQWGARAVDHVLLSRLLWNPEANADSVLSDFWSSYYPTTSETMRRYAAQLEVASGSFKLLKQRVRFRGRIFDLRHQLRGMGQVFLPGHLEPAPAGPDADPRLNLAGMHHAMRGARAALDSARAACGDSTEALRLDEEAHRFAYGEATLDFHTALLTLYTLHRQGDAQGARAQWPLLEAAAGRLREMRDVVQVSASHANAADGFEATRLTEYYELLRQFYQNPR
jgi:hypothetical protein